MIDAELVARRRGDLGLSRRALAREIGATSQLITRLEDGSNHPYLTVGFPSNLADALGVELADLFDRGRAAVEPSPLSEQVGALLLHAGVLVDVGTIASAIGATLDEVERALADLDSMLLACGLTVHRLSHKVSIQPVGHVDTEALKQPLRRQRGRNGMTLTEARVLAQVAAGIFDDARMSNPDGVALARLRNAGLVDRDSVSLTEDVQAAGLCRLEASE